MNFNPNEPPNGDFAAYVEALVNQASRAHTAQRHELTSAAKPAKAVGQAQARPGAKTSAAAQAVLHAAREASANQALGKLKGWLVKGAIGAVALFVLLPMLINWWDETDDPSAVGVVLVLAVIAFRWWLASRR